MPMLVTDIIWDTDGYEADLPNEVEVPDGLSDDEVADYLSDTYGWLVHSFALPMDDGDCDEFGEYVNKAEGMTS